MASHPGEANRRKASSSGVTSNKHCRSRGNGCLHLQDDGRSIEALRDFVADAELFKDHAGADPRRRDT
jgi:hypothetical protein